MTRYKCTNCEEEISFLHFREERTDYGSCDIGENEIEDCDTNDTDYGQIYYSCPECQIDLGETDGEVFENLVAIDEEGGNTSQVEGESQIKRMSGLKTPKIEEVEEVKFRVQKIESKYFVWDKTIPLVVEFDDTKQLRKALKSNLLKDEDGEIKINDEERTRIIELIKKINEIK